LPIVYSHIVTKKAEGFFSDHLAYGRAGDTLTVPFQPDKLCMLPDSGRVYHPAPDKCGGIGLVRSKLAIEFSQYFGFEANDGSNTVTHPSYFSWKGKKYTLTNELLKCAGQKTQS